MTNETTQTLLANVLRSEAKAKTLLKKFTFRQLATATQKQLGITPAAYQRLSAGIELGRRVQESLAEYSTKNKITSSHDAIAYCRQTFARLATDRQQEEFWIVTLDTKNKPIEAHQITVGTLDASLVHPREVFKPAILDSASSILLVHTHPSGDPTPSREDIQVTDRLTEVGKIQGIDVLDHIVIGRTSAVSIREYR